MQLISDASDVFEGVLRVCYISDVETSFRTIHVYKRSATVSLTRKYYLTVSYLCDDSGKLDLDIESHGFLRLQRIVW